ncbi:glycoside hydrolase family 32 protein [Deinococcus petrolearius]|uniref:Glycoside hydrolase family 32 protein n=1 Tax=Deinococcus petrolearius TaxID=1751295 RepID=A0ABW1DF47_9DEIO
MSPDVPIPTPAWRPLVHFTPRQHWINDPNGLVKVGEVYHLFYQHNPQGSDHANMSWGHASSRDLLRWQEHDVALPGREAHAIFSGSAVVDTHNTSGLGRSGDASPPVVALYTGAGHSWQAQYLAYSRDAGETWHFGPDQPVLDEGRADFRDPKVFWHGPSGRWVKVVVYPDERQIALYGSPDLHVWTPLSVFGPAGETGGIWEVPDLFPLTDEAGQEHWVMKVDVFAGGPQGGTGAQYFVGDFDGTVFTPHTPARWADYGKDFYAAITWSGTPGRRLWTAWQSSWDYATRLPTHPWRGALTLARELGLRRGPDGEPWLTQKPLRELDSLRDRQVSLHLTPEAPAVLPLMPERALDLCLTLTPGTHLSLRLTSEAGDELSVEADLGSGTLTLKRPACGLLADVAGFGGTHAAPLPPVENGALDLRILLDTSSVELFTGGGLLALSDLYFPEAMPQRLHLSATEGEVTGVGWTLRAVAPGETR